ncbi:MAG: Na+/H+ antiporter NhaC [Eubacteriaceae bacterium]|nr:Na+/H+ antiporter NhaC [Eubacteriaceae bacterium]
MGRKIPVWQCLIVILAMVLLLMWSILVDDGGEPHIALILAASVAAIIGAINGWKWPYMEQAILASINRSMQACLILAIVGCMIASWMAAGTIPSMMYYGIKVISPKIFLVTACILCSIVSLATGSSWSTAGSMGVALIGVGTALGFPAAMTAGAVVSGAYFGDKMSPLSDTTNLAPAMAGANLFDHIKHMIYTTGTTLVIALVAYAIMGFFYASNNAPDLSTLDEITAFIQSSSKVSVIALIPPIFVIAAVALKLPALPSLIGGVFIGVPFMFWNKAAIEAAQGLELKNCIFTTLNNGIEMAVVPEDASLIIEKLGALLSGSGMQGMFWTISIILCAMCFGGIVDATGVMGTFAGILLKVAKGRGGLVLATEFSCIVVNAICCDQYLALVLPGRMFKESFEDMKLAPKNLSRCLEDSGTITSNFFPWNTCGATMRKFLGVDSSYIPFAILNWLNPLVSIFFGFTGITMEKMTDEEYARIMEAREAEKAAALKALEA